jgi:hypothetical protein
MNCKSPFILTCAGKTHSAIISNEKSVLYRLHTMTPVPFPQVVVVHAEVIVDFIEFVRTPNAMTQRPRRTPFTMMVLLGGGGAGA